MLISIGDNVINLEMDRRYYSGSNKKNNKYIHKIVNHYNLNQEEQNELKEAIEESKTQLKINLTNSNQYKRNLAVQFQRSFDDIDEETAKSIIELLNKGE